MKRFALAFLVLCSLASVSYALTVPLECDITADLTFSPNEGTDVKLVKAIQTCTPGEELLVAAYSFTSTVIVDALVAAKHAGVDVRLYVDKGQEKDRRSGWKACALAGIPVYFDVIHHIQHNKYMVFGSRGVTFGSFNFSSNAEHGNAENNVVVWSSSLAKAYAENWKALVAKAREAVLP